MEPTTFRIACAGAGYFAQLHHSAWLQTGGASLTGIADPDGAAAGPDGVPRFHSLEAMLAESPADILDIVTPPDTHAALIETAIRHGVTRIIC